MPATQAQHDWVKRVLDIDPVARGAGTRGGLSLVRLARARLGWRNDRLHAIAEIGRLQGALAREFGPLAEQKSALEGALRRLDGLVARLADVLDNGLDEILNAADPARRQTLQSAVKATLAAVVETLTRDPVMVALDGNEVLPDMDVAAPLRRRVGEIVGALA